MLYLFIALKSGNTTKRRVIFVLQTYNTENLPSAEPILFFFYLILGLIGLLYNKLGKNISCVCLPKLIMLVFTIFLFLSEL